MWSFRLDIGTQQAVEVARRREGLSRSAWIAAAIKEKLAREARQ